MVTGYEIIFSAPSSDGTQIQFPYAFYVNNAPTSYGSLSFSHYDWRIIDSNGIVKTSQTTEYNHVIFQIFTLNLGQNYTISCRFAYKNNIGNITYSSEGLRTFVADYKTPNIPGITSPTSGTETGTLKPTFTFTTYNAPYGSDGTTHTATQFRIYSGANIIYDKTLGAVTSHIVDTDLPSNISLRAQVRYKNEYKWSDWSNFVYFYTILTVPETPIITYPINNSTNINNAINIIASTYTGLGSLLNIEWRVSTYGGNITAVSGNDPFNTFNTTSTTLSNYVNVPFATYQNVWVAVRYQNIKGWSAWSNVSTFRTQPVLPIAPTVQSISENIINHSLTVNLNSYTGEGTLSQTEYIISTSPVYTATNYYISGPNNITSGNLFYFNTISLSGNIKYYIFVKFKNERGWSSPTTAVFITSADVPKKPVTNRPYYNEINVSFISISLLASEPLSSINEALTTSQLTGVEWQIGNSTFSTIYYTSTEYNYLGPGHSLYSNSITNLLNNTLYYWRVRYSNSIGWSEWSNPSKFTTKIYYVPSTPTITYPTNDLTDVSITPTITSSVFSSGGGESHYSSDWEICDSIGNIIWWSYDNVLNLTSITTSNLPTDTLLKVRVRYKNIGETSDWSGYVTFRTISTVPTKPSIISPINGQIDVSLTPVIIGSSYYSTLSHYSSDWEISNNGTFSGADIIFSSYDDTTNKTSISVSPALTRNILYYVRVRYTNSKGDSTWSNAISFRTIVNIPSTPVLSTPIDDATDQSQNPTLVSSAYSGDATHLSSIWQVSIDSGFETIIWTKTSTTDKITTIVNSNGTFNTSLLDDITKLNSNSDYYWRVAYVNKAGQSLWSTAFMFTTLTTVPKTPSITSHIDGIRQIELQPDFTSSEYYGDATHLTSTWTLKDEGGNTVWQSVDDAVNLISINITDGTFIGSHSGYTELLNDTWYFISVKYANSEGYSEYSSVIKFHSVVLVPTKPSILNTAIDDVLNIAYTINSSAFLIGAGEGYHISSDWEIATDSGFTDIFYQSINNETNLTSIVLPTLDLLTYYFVRVRYTNESGTSTWSDTYAFRTIVHVANTPFNILPINNAVSIDWENNITLQTSAYSSYEIPQVKPHLATDWIIATDYEFTNIVWSSINNSTNLIQIIISGNTLPTNSLLYWKVRHKNIGGYTNWSTVTSFTTLPAYPQIPVILYPEENSEYFYRENGIISSSKYVGEGTHIYSDWEIYTYDYNSSTWTIAWKIKTAEISNYLLNVSVNNTIGTFQGVLSGKSQLDYFTEYKFRVRHSNEKGYSSWSNYITAKSTYDPPNIPTGLYPENKSIGQLFHPELIASDYSGNGNHISSIWQIATDDSFADIIWEGISIGENVPLTSIIVNDVNGTFTGSMVGEDSLDYNVTYYWRVSYKNQIEYSSYSIPISFTTKKYEQNIILTSDLEKKLEYLINRFVNKDIEQRHPKFKQFIEHWLRFMDTYNNQYIFNMTKFNTIKEFYELVEIFDWADDIKNAKFQNFMSSNSLDILQNIYFGGDINPEILRFFRSLNTRKGSPLSFQILMRLLGYKVTVTNNGPFKYKVTSIDGKIRTEEDLEKFVNVINLFHPAGMEYETTAELLTEIISLTPSVFMNNELLFDNSIITGIVLQTIRDSYITNTLVSVLKTSVTPTYNQIDLTKLEQRYGWIPADFNNVLIVDFDTPANEIFRVQRESYNYNE